MRLLEFLVFLLYWDGSCIGRCKKKVVELFFVYLVNMFFSILVFWDNEEYGFVGLMEWGEDNVVDLIKNCVVYFNVDEFINGG